MERNPNDLNTTSTGGELGNTGGTTGSAGYGSSGLGSTGGTATNSGLGGTAPLADSYGSSNTGGMSGSTGGDTEGRTEQLKQTAQDKASQAREALGNAGSKAKDWKQSLEQTLADRLESSAEKLRARNAPNTGSESPAFASASGGTMAATSTGDGQITKVASGLDATADWLRNGDLQSTIEEQARTNPGRTLLVALGVGYLLGKALRR